MIRIIGSYPLDVGLIPTSPTNMENAREGLHLL